MSKFKKKKNVFLKLLKEKAKLVTSKNISQHIFYETKIPIKYVKILDKKKKTMNRK